MRFTNRLRSNRKFEARASAESNEFQIEFRTCQRPAVAEDHEQTGAHVVAELQLRQAEHDVDGGQIGAVRPVHDPVADALGELQAGQFAFLQLKAILREDRQLYVRQPGRVAVLRVADLLNCF